MRICFVPHLFGWMVAGLFLCCTTQAQPFTYTFIQPDLPDLSYGSVAFADYDQDGDVDLVASGNTNPFLPFTPAAFFARSQGDVQGVLSWTHTYQQSTVAALWHSSMAWSDYDNDGDLDLLMSGATRVDPPFDAVARLYRNEGGQFQQVDTDIAGVVGGKVSWADYDNDGDEDLLVMGASASEAVVTQLYRNDDGRFEAVATNLRALAFGDIAWGDYDNDQDLDVVISGADEQGTFFTTLYRNDGAGGFTETQAPLPALVFSSLDWGDYDGDGDLDLVVSGGQIGTFVFDGVVKLYRNNGGTFSEANVDLPGVLYGVVSWGDYDNDGDLDLLLTGGRRARDGRISRIYRNEGLQFQYAATLASAFIRPGGWSDYDNDGDLDLLLAGLNASNLPLTSLYRNDLPSLNTLPEPPDGLQASVQGNSVMLTWSAASDDQTPTSGLTYAVRVGTTPGGSQVMAPHATAGTGYRWMPERGNVDHNRRWTLKNLGPGTYYWSVQAVDHSFKGSPFAPEATFTISSSTEVGTGTDGPDDLPTAFALHAAYPNPFQEATTLAYDLPERTPVVLTVYDVLGREVATLVDRVQPPGRWQVAWDVRDQGGDRVGAGLYFARMQAGSRVQTQTLVVVH